MGTTFDILKTQKNPGKIWFGLAIPATGSYLTLDAVGTPDPTQNPLAKLVGLTESGSSFGLSKTFTEEMYDEFPYPLERNLDQVGAMIKCEAAQVLDEDLITLATVGIGAPLTPTLKKAWTLGTGALSFTSIAVIAPTKADATKFVVFHLYKAYNKAPFEINISRTTRAKLALEFVGVAIPTRPAADTEGCLYYTT